MKFSTRGDEGETCLLGGQRIPKCDTRPDTYGTLDEASSTLGVAKAMTDDCRIKDIILSVQKDLLTIGSELSALPEDIRKLRHRISEKDVHRLEDLIDELQKDVCLKNEFIYPGETALSAQIDVGRTIVRRGERKAAKLKAEGQMDNPDIQRYLNRLADMLFVLARHVEQCSK